MVLKLKYPKLEDVPEQLRAAYVERDGEAMLDFDVPDVANLKKAIDSERTRAETFEKELKDERKKLGDVQRTLEAKEATGNKTEEKITELLAKWEKDKNEQIANAVAEKDKELEKLTARVTKYDLDDKLHAEFIANGGRSERAARALLIAKTEGWKLVNGVAVKHDANGEVESTSASDYFGKVLKADVPEFYEGSKGSGGHTGAPKSADSKKSDKTPQQWTEDERRAFIDANGADAYSALLTEQLMGATVGRSKA